MPGKLTEFGFEFGAAKVDRWTEDKRGVTIGITTPKQSLCIFVTPSGLIRVNGPLKVLKESDFVDVGQ